MHDTPKSPADRIGPAHPSVTAVEIDERVSLLNGTTQLVLSLNETASDIWRLADGDHTLNELVALLAVAYSQDSETIRPQVTAVVAELVAGGFLVTEEPLL